MNEAQCKQSDRMNERKEKWARSFEPVAPGGSKRRGEVEEKTETKTKAIVPVLWLAAAWMGRRGRWRWHCGVGGSGEQCSALLGKDEFSRTRGGHRNRT
jgi:hypothetical protein